VNKKRIFALLLMGCVSSNAFCGIKDIINTKGWFIGASAGLVWPHLGANSTSVANGLDYLPPPANYDLYSINRTPNTTGSFSFYAGYRWDRPSRIIPHYSLALHYEYLSQFSINGSVYQQSQVPSTAIYSYSYDCSSNIFTLLGKIDLYDFHSFAPYLTFGLGIASTALEEYLESYLGGDSAARVNPGYQSKTSANFTYSLGMGVDYFITPKITASLGYKYADLGNVKSGSGVSDWSDTSLSFGKLTTNTVLLSISYQLT